MHLSSSLHLPPTIIPFPPEHSNDHAAANLSVDFIDYDGVFSALQCTVTDLPLLVVESVKIDEDWCPALTISPEATFEPIEWPLAILQGVTAVLIVSTPSERRPRPTRLAFNTPNGERRFFRLDLWEVINKSRLSVLS